MASKLLMVDMPELMEKILKNLNNEIDSLYSCALVSRYWCKIAIPILWQDPFSFDEHYSLIPKYFSSLSEDTLKECGLNEKISKTLFDYAKFLKVLDLDCFERMVKQWNCIEHFEYTYIEYIEYIEQDDWKKCPSTNLLVNSLLKLFIESGATLHKLVVSFHDSIMIMPEKIFSLLGRNESFFSQLQHLSLDEISLVKIESAIAFLRALPKYTTKISALEFNGFEFTFTEAEYDQLQLIHALIYIIKSQKQLRLFSIVIEETLAKHYGIISALESQKNSLQEIIVENCDYSEEFEVLKNCKNLETLRFRTYCDYKIPLKMLDYNKINTLDIVDDIIETREMALILEKTGISLQRLKVESRSEQIQEDSLLLNALKSFCPNITYLYIFNIGFSTQLIEVIGNLQKLQFLTLMCNVDDVQEEEMKIRVMQFAKILPLTLQYLDLVDKWLETYIDIFLNHCNSPLRKLIFEKLENEKNTKALIEFCVRKKTLNYVGLDDPLMLDNNIRKEMEAYVELVPYEDITIDC
ncbi:hypothetical protein F8M41_020122 [Gigaspora margarita]|uniref:F-box domain-containing protein n=1 Tax=Gigaspora margarita TaxID=4874 RepID=A0A8H4AIW5_GIGMA|nr:hypothetical protein F8M41_020122 [Gigaspora margarita]